MFIQQIVIHFNGQRFSYASMESSKNNGKVIDTAFMTVFSNFRILGPTNQVFLHSRRKIPIRLSDIASSNGNIAGI